MTVIARRGFSLHSGLIVAAMALALAACGGSGGGGGGGAAGGGGTTPPDTAAPANVSSFNGAAGNAQVAFSWVNPADSDFAGVRICWSTTANPTSPTGCGANVANVAKPATGYTVTSLANVTTYFTAFAYDGTPNYSAGISITRTPSAVPDTTPPGDVTGLGGAPGSTQVALTWTNPVDPDFAGVRICWSTSASPADSTTCSPNFADVGEPATSKTVTGLTGSTAYFFTAFAYDGSGNYASGASITSTTSAADTTPPGNVTGLGGVAGNTQVALTWANPADSDFAGVRICWSTSANPADPTACSTNSADVAQPATSKTVTSLSSSTGYYFTAFAYDGLANYASGVSITRATTAVADTTPPANVTAMIATPGDTQVALSWTNPADSDLAGVRICWSTISYQIVPSSCANHYDNAGTGTGYTVTGLTNDVQVRFTAFAYDAVPNFAAPTIAARVTSIPTAGPLTALITAPASNATIAPAGTVSFAGSASGGTSPYTYAWNFDQTGLGGASPATSTSASPGNVSFSAVGAYTVQLTVTDTNFNTAQTTRTVTVQLAAPAQALYPSNGGNWNDYVKNDGTGAADATGAACDAATDGPGYGACLHGGEIRAIAITSQSSCAGLTITDSLGAFNWICDGSVNPVRAVSTGLKDGMYLSDLLDFTAPGWKLNIITVQNATPSTVFTSTPAVWWSNPVVVADTGLTLGATSPSTVYVVTQDVAADYSIKSSKTALVVKPGAKMTRVAGPYGALYLGDPNSGSVYMDFMWIEGAVSAPTTTAINGNLHRFSMFRNVNIVGPGVTGVSVPCAKSKFVDIASTQVSNIAMSLSGRECTVHGATIDGSSYGIFIADYNSAFATGPNTVENVTVSNGVFGSGSPAGIVIGATASGTTVTNATITNPYSAGMRVNGSNSILTGISITDTSGNMGDGINVSSSASGNTLEDITVRGGSGIGIALAGTGHRVNNVDVSLMNLQGIEIRGSGHRVSNVIVANVVGSGAGAGVRLIDTSRNRVWNIMVGNTGDPPYGNYGRGIQITFVVAPQDARSDNIISNVFLVNNGIMGFDLNGAQSSLFQYMTIANTGHENSLDTTPNPVSFGGRGIRFNSSFIKGNTFNNMLISNNPDSGLDINPHVTGTSNDWVTGTTFNDLAIVGNGKRSYGSDFSKDIGTGIRLGEFAVDLVFHGALILANNGNDANHNCHVFADATVKTEAGLTNSNPDYSCTPVGSSDATLDIAIDGYGAVGAVTGDDTANQSDTNGLAAVGSVAADDWTRFAGIERMWGRAGSAFPNPDNWGMCRSPGTCQIYDWSLSASDNNFRGILPVPTGDDYLVHTFYAADATKCAAVPATWTGSVCQSTYLVNAVEVMDDGIGNDNLLCESGETCIYMPNIGAYQGHGPLISAGAFTDGVVTGVTLLKYTTNGR